jgi:hypothetical protein
MPMTNSRALAHESPMVRIRVLNAQGEHHQITISSTLRVPPELAQSEDYRTQLGAAISLFLAARGLEVTRIEHLTTYSMEIGT